MLAAAVAIPASMMTSAPFAGAVRPLSMSASVALSATLPANISRAAHEPAAIELRSGE